MTTIDVTTIDGAQLRREVDDLRAELAAFRAELAVEVRTGRLVVGPDGDDATTITITPGFVKLLSPPNAADDHGSRVELYAGPDAAVVSATGILDHPKYQEDGRFNAVLYASAEPESIAYVRVTADDRAAIDCEARLPVGA